MATRPRWSAHLVSIAAVVGSTAFGGCFPVAAPRFPESIATALTQPMRGMETENLLLYYPEGRQQEARRFASHVEGCVAYLKWVAKVHNTVADQKMTVILPELPYNNAFVAPRLVGYDTEAVVPTYATLDLFSLEMGQPPDAANMACHEITHYVHFQQIAGFAWFWNALFGAVYTPQIGLDSWFDEGLAVYYETRLQPGTGRLAWPFWRGMFAAGYAGRRINGGDLSVFQRDFYGGNNYLVGSQFVRFLANRYGEKRLWRLVRAQARSIFFPLWVNLRFWQVYDKTLSTLIDEFADEVEAHLPPKPRPPGQRVVRDAGTSARYVRALDGSEALITSDHDSPARLLVYAPDGSLRAERTLTDVLPPRRLAIGASTLTSGLSFTADAQTLYFVSLDIDPIFQASRLYRFDVQTGKLTVAHPDLRGSGGSVSPDGRRYLFARADGDHHDLAEVDLTTGNVRVIFVEPHGAYLTHPRLSPDGSRVVVAEFDRRTFRIVVFDAVSGRPTSVLPTGGGPVHDPSWVDGHRILYLGTAATDAGFQAYVHDLVTARTDRVTEAPYLVFEPRAAQTGSVRFLNRQGWHWTVDEVPLPPAIAVAATPHPLPPVALEAPRDPIPGTVAPSVGDDDAAVAREALPPPVAGESPPPDPAAQADVSLPPGADEGTPAGTASPLPSRLGPPDESAWNIPPSEAAVGPPPTILSDKPYSAFDHLFIPRLYGPTLLTVGRQAASLGLVLSGNDRLSLHRWAIAGFYQPVAGGAAGFLVDYTNRQLAPLTLMLSVSQIAVHDAPPVLPGETAPSNPAFTLFRRDRQISMDAARAFYENPIDLGFSLLETYRPGDPDVSVPLRRFAGPHLAASFLGVERTPYGGARRLFAIGTSVGVYPRSWNTAGLGFVDTRTEINGVVPLPLFRRHVLAFGVRGRELVGVQADQGLLVVGGYSSTLLKRSANRPAFPATNPALLPPGLSFIESLRGFEDYPLRTDRVFIADAAYRCPFIIDWGTASTLGLLPAFFVRQLDFELFGAAATDARSDDRHLALGGALTLQLALWQVPFDFQYQVARRTTDDRGLVQLVMLGL
jgi:hypothetical protein